MIIIFATESLKKSPSIATNDEYVYTAIKLKGAYILRAICGKTHCYV